MSATGGNIGNVTGASKTKVCKDKILKVMFTNVRNLVNKMKALELLIHKEDFLTLWEYQKSILTAHMTGLQLSNCSPCIRGIGYAKKEVGCACISRMI